MVLDIDAVGDAVRDEILESRGISGEVRLTQCVFDEKTVRLHLKWENEDGDQFTAVIRLSKEEVPLLLSPQEPTFEDALLGAW